MKKVLIYLNGSSLAPVGGADGYNYTLKQGLESIKTNDFEISYLQGKSSAQNINSQIKQMKNTKFRNTISAAKSIAKKGMMMYGPVHKAAVDLREYDAVHFHRTMDMYWAKDDLKNYKGKVILTLHAPTMPSKQMFSMLTDFEKKHMKWFYSKLPEIDNYAINRADNIVIACEDAEEPYYHEWPGYPEFHEKNKGKYVYMTTGTAPKSAHMSKEEMRVKYGIQQDAFVVSYVGRHNEIKGYDSLKEIGENLLNKYKDIYFFIAGTEGPLYHLENERWIEVGWTKDPGSVVQAADLFVLPNKETYFDLIMLEVLSLGQIVVASYTGGNKYFEKYKDAGIFLYNNIAEAVNVIERLYNMTDAEKLELRTKNLKLYESEFTNEAFAKRYIASLHKILD